MKYLRDITSWRSSWRAHSFRVAWHAGMPYRTELVEFGERVHCMPVRPRGARQAKLDPKWQDGAFIGIRDRGDEMLIMTSSGVYKTRSVRRRPELERWDFEFLTLSNSLARFMNAQSHQVSLYLQTNIRTDAHEDRQTDRRALRQKQRQEAEDNRRETRYRT